MAFVQLKDNKGIDLQQTIEVASGQTSDWYIMPNITGALAMSLIPDGTAQVEYTLDGDGARADTAEPLLWPPGAVAVNTEDLARGVSAVRVVSTTGAAKLFIRESKG